MGNGSNISGTYACKHWILDSVRCKKKILEILHLTMINERLPIVQANLQNYGAQKIQIAKQF
jgi:hypothetical protein